LIVSFKISFLYLNIKNRKIIITNKYIKGIITKWSNAIGVLSSFSTLVPILDIFVPNISIPIVKKSEYIIAIIVLPGILEN